MKTMNSFLGKLGLCLCILTLVSLPSCLKDGDETIILETGNGTGIPGDDKADPNPDISSPTSVIPNIQYTPEMENGFHVIRIDMTGIQHPETFEWIRLLGTGDRDQNVWLSLDGKPKGLTVYNTIDDDDNKDRKVMNDVVFLVDNSGSMSEEADLIAHDIVAWAQKLEKTLDVRFGCVGYDGTISGALNLTTYSEMSQYLDRATGTKRTIGFGGPDASSLYSASHNYYVGASSSSECGVAALRFADEQFDFRSGANRIYVNFTDEPNQPKGSYLNSVEYVDNKWLANMGIIHTVYSGDRNFVAKQYNNEYPWAMSESTGGTVLYASPDFSNVSLDTLPVTGSMQNSYVIRFTNVNDQMDGKSHDIKITVLTKDNKVRAERHFSSIFGSL